MCCDFYAEQVVLAGMNVARLFICKLTLTRT